MNELEIVGRGVHLYPSDLQFLGVRLASCIRTTASLQSSYLHVVLSLVIPSSRHTGLHKPGRESELHR